MCINIIKSHHGKGVCVQPSVRRARFVGVSASSAVRLVGVSASSAVRLVGSRSSPIVNRGYRFGDRLALTVCLSRSSTARPDRWLPPPPDTPGAAYQAAASGAWQRRGLIGYFQIQFLATLIEINNFVGYRWIQSTVGNQWYNFVAWNLTHPVYNFTYEINIFIITGRRQHAEDTLHPGTLWQISALLPSNYIPTGLEFPASALTSPAVMPAL